MDRIGYTGDGPADELDPPEPKAAPFCDGPGHLYAPTVEFDRVPGDLRRIVEHCPTCARGPYRNHRSHREAALLEEAS